MKKIFFLALILFSSVTAVHAQNDGWGGDGLSEDTCKWVYVTLKQTDTTEVWQKCNQGETRCFGKFCNGPGTSADNTVQWEKDQCDKYCITLQEKLPMEGGQNVRSISGSSGVDLLGNYFSMWYKIGALVLGLICVLVIVISGVQIMFGGASEEAVTSAKARIWGALLSLILLFSSALILRTINPLFFT